MSLKGVPQGEELTQLINLGMLVESLTFPDIPMTEAIPKVLNSPLLLQSLTGSLHLAPQDLKSKLEELSSVLKLLPHDNRQWALTSSIILFNLLAAMAVFLRIRGRRKVTDRLWHDDWWAIISVVCLIFSGILYNCTTHIAGGCHHIWDLPFNSIKLWILLVIFCEISFALSMVPVKISFLVFYYSLSPDIWYRRSIFAVGFLTVAVGLVGSFLFAFQCQPTDYWNHLFDAKCIDRKVLFSIWGGMIVVTDFMILLLPVQKVAQLNFRKKEKIIIIGMFSAGGLICIASILRSITFYHIFLATDVTMMIFGPGIWSTIELAVAIVISCFPAIKHLLHNPGSSKRSPSSFSLKFHSMLRKKIISTTQMSEITTRDDDEPRLPPNAAGKNRTSGSTMRSGGLRSWGSRFIITRTTATTVTTKSGLTTFGRDEEEMMFSESSRAGGLSAPGHYKPQRCPPSRIDSSHLGGVLLEDIEKPDTKD